MSDTVFPPYFVATAAVELGFFKDEGHGGGHAPTPGDLRPFSNDSESG